MYHKPVMLTECIEGLNLKEGGTYADLTLGGAGHAIKILENLKGGRLFGFDQDEDALRNVPEDPRFTFVHHNFRFIKNFMRYYDALPLDGILADLGVSSFQIDQPEKGFSTRFDGDLDMRMDKRAQHTAADVLNTYEEEKLLEVFKLYGELPNARGVASTIAQQRGIVSITTTTRLKSVLQKHAPRGFENKFLAQVFQALRIEVNDEMGALEEMLTQAVEVLAPGGRLVVMSYHSLEDRLVKNLIKCGNTQGVVHKDFYGNVITKVTPITKKPITASESEVKENPRARSAKLRIGEKLP
jgi:16S rRNA (cytosine1402-N4)-methyltransferase